MSNRINVDFVRREKSKAQTLYLEINGQPQEMQWGPNTVEVPAGRYKVRAYLRVPTDSKFGVTRPLTIAFGECQSVDLVYHLAGSTVFPKYRLEVVGRESASWRAIPPWAWLFVVLCAAIPIASLGGGLALLLGFGGVAACAAISRARGLPVEARMLFCLVVTVACWIVLVLFVLGMQRLLT